MRILLFAQLAELAGSRELEIPGITDTEELCELMNKKYPGFKDCPYLVAVNREIVNERTGLKSIDEVALLPPFSGG